MANVIEIWQPRYKDRTVLLATYKVKDGENLIKFTKAPELKGLYRVDGSRVRACPISNNGKIDCFTVPLSYLEKVE